MFAAVARHSGAASVLGFSHRGLLISIHHLRRQTGGRCIGLHVKTLLVEPRLRGFQSSEENLSASGLPKSVFRKALGGSSDFSSGESRVQTEHLLK